MIDDIITLLTKSFSKKNKNLKLSDKEIEDNVILKER